MLHFHLALAAIIAARVLASSAPALLLMRFYDNLVNIRPGYFVNCLNVAR
jgi:hypothetical protein